MVDLLISNGFYFDKLHVPMEGMHGGVYIQVRYPPTSLIEAREFIRKYRQYGEALPVGNRYKIRNTR